MFTPSAIMEDHVASIKALCEAIKSSEFSHSGIFTNAMITRPELTTLIRDALVPEQKLYRISKALPLQGTHVSSDRPILRRQSGAANDEYLAELIPERVDGKLAFGSNSLEKYNETAVAPPLLIEEDQLLSDSMSLPTKREIVSQYTLIPRRAIESQNPIEMCDAILALDESSSSIKGLEHSKRKASELKLEYRRLTTEIFELEPQTSEAYKPDAIYNLLTQEINNLIAVEQAEVDRLERELELTK